MYTELMDGLMDMDCNGRHGQANGQEFDIQMSIGLSITVHVVHYSPYRLCPLARPLIVYLVARFGVKKLIVVLISSV